jgi:peptidoglycan/xylan/chitin deacetylase (PgdA/CDA1 family)
MGSVIISIDAELAWGFHDMSSPPKRRVEGSRQGWKNVLALLSEWDIPATWAIVGHLFEETCDGSHADHPLGEAWFDHEVGADATPESLRVAPDLVEQVIRAPQNHEIASHTYSHPLFGEDDVTATVARRELQRCRELAAEWGIKMSSVIFPRNSVGHLDILKEEGFQTYRTFPPGTYVATQPAVRKAVSATVAPKTPPLVTPERDENGLVNIPATLYLYGVQGIPRRVISPIWGDPVVRWAKRGIDAAAKQPGVFHMWLHPNNVIAKHEYDRLRDILAYLASVRERTDLVVETMEQASERSMAVAEREQTGASREAGL